MSKRSRSEARTNKGLHARRHQIGPWHYRPIVCEVAISDRLLGRWGEACALTAGGCHPDKCLRGPKGSTHNMCIFFALSTQTERNYSMVSVSGKCWLHIGLYTHLISTCHPPEQFPVTSSFAENEARSPFRSMNGTSCRDAVLAHLIVGVRGSCKTGK